eukprot:Rhum_TRINITY_DN21217_c0_g1::Rhum_TRINITY_DN21217_c0_g1_i1::g.173497::m.173497
MGAWFSRVVLHRDEDDTPHSKDLLGSTDSWRDDVLADVRGRVSYGDVARLRASIQLHSGTPSEGELLRLVKEKALAVQNGTEVDALVELLCQFLHLARDPLQHDFPRRCSDVMEETGLTAECLEHDVSPLLQAVFKAHPLTPSTKSYLCTYNQGSVFSSFSRLQSLLWCEWMDMAWTTDTWEAVSAFEPHFSTTHYRLDRLPVRNRKCPSVELEWSLRIVVGESGDSTDVQLVLHHCHITLPKGGDHATAGQRSAELHENVKRHFPTASVTSK